MLAIKRLPNNHTSSDQKTGQLSEPPISQAEKNVLKDRIVDAYDDFRAAVATGDKEYIRRLHLLSRDFVSEDYYSRTWHLFNKHYEKFIDGCEIDPQKIRPSLHLVEAKSVWEEIFKVVRHTWSIPYSKGYGRRMRFVVFDEYHEAVIGIIGFQSPPADLACRDNLFNYPDGQKLDLVNRTMDVYTIGAIPPYSHLLGGKLVAGLVASDEVRQAYWRLYAGKRTVMQDEMIEQPLVAATTTSAFGRSSIYNRLKCGDRLLAEPIGYTKGYGTIHLEHVYPDVVRMLKGELEDFVTGGYGNGPKIRWQNFTRALQVLGLPSRYFEHGLQREAFLFRFVENLEDGMAGGDFGKPIQLSTGDYADFWKERWALPRAERITSWKEFNSEAYFAQALKRNYGE
ncbi:uncharacterized protein DUF4338 [Sulfuritortus calidifontis]|uniref:Uncharacterized protein DUF4338 n=1 Tax=Sulfuritortus calidifontis TaxID=1914471 RepID=A0A4R3JYT4_9PROT|nr:Druantia anti-phage system protein DruA [Sulfuritortus calidifontis]TCS72154.1 uncharacterized protein DUF4338 [Sulfuritortus calidifontis]